MKQKQLALAAATMLGGLFGTPALAQDNPAPAPGPAPSAQDNGSGFYVGGGINLYFVDKDDAAEGMPIIFEDQPSPGAFMGRFGYAFNNYVAIEVEAGIGGAKSEFEGPGLEAEVGVETPPLSAHVVGTVPFGEGGGYLLGKAGYTSVTISRTLNGVDFDDLDISGASFGFGGGVRSDMWDFRMEYSFVSGGDANTGVLGMTAMRRF